MLQKLSTFNKKHQLFFKKNKLIIAFSGGVDSVVLLHLIKNFDVELVVAHCNFQLRGKDSDQDQVFAKQLAEFYKIKFQTIIFDTKQYAKENKLSIEEAARDLRYEWFEKIRTETNANLIVTAHHLNDNTETLLNNLAKGTGIKGLRGMLPKRGKIIRPFLEFTKADILHFAQKNKLSFREDKSNNSLKYTRNLIRKNIIPEIEKINNNFLKTQKNHFERFRDIELFYNDVLLKIKKEIFEEKKGDIYISIKKILKYNGYQTLFFELMNPYGFSNLQTSDILKKALVENTIGQSYFSKTHRIIKLKNNFVLSDIRLEKQHIFSIENNQTKIKLPLKEMIRIHIKPIEKLTKMSSKKHFAYLDFDKLAFPLTLRRKKDGDYFYPFGMYGNKGQAKKKKLKKYFADQKLSVIDKENTWVLCAGEKIVWIVNQRIDDRFKVTEKTKKIFQLKFVECKN